MSYLKKHQFLSIWIWFFILLSIIIGFYVSAFTPNTDEIKAANSLASQGIINNQRDNPSKYNLWANITRREMLKVMMNLSWDWQGDTCDWLFADLNSSDWWCYYAEKALKLWYISPNKNYRPDDNVSKIESIKMVFSARDVQVENTQDWRIGYVNKAVELGIISWLTDYDTAAKRWWIFLNADNTINAIWEKPVLKAIPEKIEQKITFASAMNRESVEKNIRIYPDLDTSLTWESDSELRIEVTNNIDDDVDVVLNILEDATDTLWNTLEEPIIKRFKVSGPTKIDFITPEWEITDLTKNITVRFSRPMVSLINLDNQEKCPITILPNLPWKCVWITTSTFQFRPENDFPIWWSYRVIVPAWIESVSWTKTTNWKNIVINTPKFQVINTVRSINTDKPLLITFNSDVDLNKFINNFSINRISKSDLNINYFKVPSSIEWEYDIKKNIIEIMPKSWFWWYWKSFNYTIWAWLTSLRWNIWLSSDINSTFSVNKLLLSSRPFIYRDENRDDKTLTSNLKFSQNSSIVTKENPKIFLSFYEEVDLNKSFFSLWWWDFDLKYWKYSKYEDGKNVIYEDKKSVIIEYKWNVWDSLNLNILASKISKSSDDINVSFKTKNENKVESFKFIDYKRSCVIFSNPIWYDNYNLDKFDFGWKYWIVNYISRINRYSNVDWCSYEENKNKYLFNTLFNPNSNYNLTIKKEFVDLDNYWLTGNFSTSFFTWPTLNEDKYFSYVDWSELKLVPTDISPLWVAIRTQNLDKVSVEVCEGDFDMTSTDYIKNTSCEKKTIWINNLWFKANFTVLDLNQIYWSDFEKSIVTLHVSKLDEDKTKYELDNNNRYNSKIKFLRTDKSIVLKSAKKWLVWLYDYKTWENLTDLVSKIDLYSRESDYSIFGKYLWQKSVFQKSLNFSAKSEWLYEIDMSNDSGWNNYLFTLKSWEQILLNSYSYYNDSRDIRTYLTTDKPVYKPGETVKIKWVVREQTSSKYILTSWSYNLKIRTPEYKTAVSEQIDLSSNSSFSYEFELDKDASLWNYNIDFIWWYLSFAVEEYEKPDFKVETSSDKDYYLYPEVANVEVSSEYYIGTPLSNWEWQYRLNSRDFDFYPSNISWYTWWKDNYFWWGTRYYDDNSYPSFWESKSFILWQNWKQILNIEWFTSWNKIYSVDTTIVDPNTKKSISDTTSFKMLETDTFVWMKLNKYYYEYWDTVNMSFLTLDIDEKVKANQPINLNIYKITNEYDKNTYSFTSSEELLEERSFSTDSKGKSTYDYKINDYGEFRFEILLANGKYKTVKTIYVSGRNLVTSPDREHDLAVLSDKDSYDIWDNAEFIIMSPEVWVKALVTVEKYKEVLFSDVINIDSTTQKYNLNIKKEYLPNFDFKVYLIKHTQVNEGAFKELQSVRKEMFEIEKIISWSGSEDIIPYYVSYDLVYKWWIIPIIPNDNIDKSLLEELASLRVKEQKLMQDILPNYYSWLREVKISLDSITLNSSVNTDKDNYLPSDRTVIDLYITDDSWNPVNWESLVSVIDESLLALKNNDTDIKDFFYSELSNQIYTFWNMINLIKRFEFRDNEERSQEDTDWLDFGVEDEEAFSLWANSVIMEKSAVSESLDDASIMWDMAPTILWWSDKNSNATKVRTDFKDLAYYNSTVNLVNGKARLVIPKLPDNLTTWVVKWYTITPDTKVGNFESSFKVVKDLNLLPSIPRFFMSSDEFEITANAINNTDRPLQTSAELSITNAQIISSPESIVVSARSQGVFKWRVKIDWLNDNINWDKFFSEITMSIKSWDLVDSIKTSREIIPYSTPEYTFTNGSTYDLSYEEKIFLPNSIDKTQGSLDISMWATILTSLLDSVDSTARSPLDNFYNTVSALKKWALIKWLYEKAWRLDDFYKIEVVDYLWDTHKLNDLMLLRLKEIKDYQNRKGSMMVYSECRYAYFWNNDCSNFDLTWEFLSMAKTLKDYSFGVDQGVVDNALKYYKSELDNIILKVEDKWWHYRNIDTFYKLIWYDKSYISKYLLSDRFVLSDYEFDTISKLKMITLLQYVSPSNPKINTYISELKNNTIIEARGTMIPANTWRWNNIESTSLALMIFMESRNSEKLIIENMARWLLAQKRESWEFGSRYNSNSVIEAIIEYIVYTGELDNVDMTAKWYLNWDILIEKVFNDTNKFDLESKSFSLKDYINFWTNNSLWFEKEWTWKLYYDVWLRYFLPVEEIEPRDEWIIVKRDYYDYEEYRNAFKTECISPMWFYGYMEDDYSYGRYGYNYCSKKKVKNIDSVNSGQKWDMLVWELEIIVPQERNNVVIEAYIPAWAEIINTNFDTSSPDVKELTWEDSSRWYGWFSNIQVRDEKLELFAQHLYVWSYKYTYVIKLNHIWEYHHRPATAYELKKPEIWWRTRGEWFKIK